MHLDPILVFLGTALVSPVLGWLAHLAIEAAKNRRAIRILRDEPLAYEGARFFQLLSAAGTQLMGPGRIAGMTRKRIEFRGDDGSAMTCTPRELVDAYPRWMEPEPDEEGSAAPPRRRRRGTGRKR